jgi:hypothetical protein
VSRSLVVDASAALKWVVTEPGSEKAASLLDEMTVGAVTLLAPEHLVGEVANGLRKRVAQNVLTVEDACKALDCDRAPRTDLRGWSRAVVPMPPGRPRMGNHGLRRAVRAAGEGRRLRRADRKGWEA